LTLEELSFPVWWVFLPDGATAGFFGLWPADRWLHAGYVALTGLGWLSLTVTFTPSLARWQSHRGLRLLSPDAEADLSMRVAELTATRAAALDAHATELRRIERSLHDSTQNRMVAVTVLLGAARRALTRDPAGAEALMDQAQTAAEQALVELRAVARGILPPILADRGLTGALTGLAGIAPVPCEVDVDVPGRCAASVEATAYFVVSEALTNIARHSGASSAAVVVQTREDRLHVCVTDDGHGGADPEHGSGLTGIRRRVEALDGRVALTSPAGGPTTLEVELPCGS
jgi:signal transduction histidine kinase